MIASSTDWRDSFGITDLLFFLKKKNLGNHINKHSWKRRHQQDHISNLFPSPLCIILLWVIEDKIKTVDGEDWPIWRFPLMGAHRINKAANWTAKIDPSGDFHIWVHIKSTCIDWFTNSNWREIERRTTDLWFAGALVEARPWREDRSGEWLGVGGEGFDFVFIRRLTG